MYPELVKYWHTIKNGMVTPNDTISISKKNYWLLECGHEKYVSAKILSSHPKCLICTNQTLVQGFNDLATVNPDIADLWHPTKNDNALPDSVLPSSKVKVWGEDKCGHEWFASPKTVIASKTACPYCGGRELLKRFNDLETLHPEIKPYWDIEKNEISADSILPGSHTKIWLKGDCGHE